jgi:GT2 family glycosyltransferase
MDYSRQSRFSRQELAENIAHILQSSRPDHTIALPAAQLLPTEAHQHCKPVDIEFDTRSKTPSVSIIAVCFNGARDLPVFLSALSAQTYRHFDLVIVDNKSTDASVAILEAEAKRADYNIKVIRNPTNVGFAAANNQAAREASGELLALLNVDTRPSPTWLSELVKALVRDSKAAAATSKTLFWTRFVDITLTSSSPFALDLAILEHGLTYNKFFLRCGKRQQMTIHSDERHRITLSVPVHEQIQFGITSSASRPTYVDIKCGWRTLAKATLKPQQKELLAVRPPPKRGRDVINNAGSRADAHGMPHDRGFGSYDDGRLGKSHVDFFCGCSVLIRRAAVIGRSLFVPEFFAYYEDSELSRWLRSRGHRIIYAPESVVAHRHSATSQEGSPTWNYLVRRAASIFRYGGDIKALRHQLRSLSTEYAAKVSEHLAATLQTLDLNLLSRLKSTGTLVPHEKQIAVYNSYWNTQGGGELHALSIATELQRRSPVYLLSASDFSIKDLERFSGFDLKNCRKLLVRKVTPDLTADFNLFVNSTYLSSVPSKASASWYIVSFPQKTASPAFLRSYIFLCNSDFTKRWLEKYWGNTAKTDILYPVRGYATYKCKASKDCFAVKKSAFITVGRFSPHGHCKNQAAIIAAFARVTSRLRPNRYQSLHVAGSLTTSNSSHLRYFEYCRKQAGERVYFHPNCSREHLANLYMSASFYVHATGLLLDQPHVSPERCEHFGITVIEAMSHGCIPLVFHLGGPAELLRKLRVGRLFASPAELEDQMFDLAHLSDSQLSTECELVRDRALTFMAAASVKPLPA